MNAPAQGTAEWLADRAGHVTASRFKDVMAKIKSGEAASRRSYRMQLVTERLTGCPVESYTNAAMAWGTEQEPHARRAYEAITGADVDLAGFLRHKVIAWCGGSPDGLVEANGGIEIKCPYVSTVHVETLMSGMPPEHMAQVQGLMWITGREWWDFISFDPRMPDNLQLYVQRIPRDDIYIGKMVLEIDSFLLEVEGMHQQLLRRAA